MRIASCAFGLAVCLSASCASSESRPDELPESAQEGAVPGAESPEEFGERGVLAQQKRDILVQQHVERARELKDRMELEQAELELARALELDPTNLEAKQMLEEVGTLLGRPAGQSVSQSLEESYALRKGQLEAEARQNLDRARMLAARGEYDEALTELTLALDEIRWSPYSLEWQDLEQEIETLAEEVRTKQAAEATRALEESQRAAQLELREQEVADQRRRDQLVQSLITQSIESFKAQDYEQAIEYADRALRLDPRNEKAQDLRDTAFRKGRELVQDEYLRQKLEQYDRWQEDMDELKIPYQGVITLPDEDFWRQITDTRSRRAGLDLSRDIAPVETELRAQLANTRIPGLTIKDQESLTQVIQAVHAITAIPMVVDPAADQAAVDEGVVFNIELTNPISVEKVLNLITQTAGPNVTWTVRHDTVLVTTVEKARGELVIYNHDVQDLIFGLTDFLGPRIDRLRLLEELEDEDGGGAFGGIGEKPTINVPDDLATLVQENVAVGTWEQDGVSISVDGGNMIVVHSSDVQQQVRLFLEELRRFSSSLVTIESKFLVIRKGFLQEIGVDFRGLDNPGAPFTDLDDANLDLEPTLGLDNSGDGVTLTPPSAGAFLDEGGDGDIKGRTEHIFGEALGSALTTIGGLTAQYTFLNDLQISAILRLVEKSQDVELINDQVISVHNTQRAYVTVVNQQAYVQDFDVEVAQFQAIADPQINVLTEGIVLDVRPTIHHNRRYLTLEIQPTVSQVIALVDFSTTLAGQTAAVTFQLPELEVQSVFTTAVVPDGGSILIGGLSRLRNVERRAEVPWLANIPLLGFFFKEEGYDDEKESLSILIRAWISDVKEELARLEGH